MTWAREIPQSKRILEINPDLTRSGSKPCVILWNIAAAVIRASSRRTVVCSTTRRQSPKAQKIQDPAAFAKRVNELIAGQK